MKLVGFLILTFIEAVVIGSIAWFIARLFGYDWKYWGFMQWFIPISMVIDGIITVGKAIDKQSTKGGGWSNPHIPPW